uniref:non-specific serine/threonine protein kinase n=1 Tax=Ascaris suum TaxID=6253 RepID=F1L1U1_ASCSU
MKANVETTHSKEDTVEQVRPKQQAVDTVKLEVSSAQNGLQHHSDGPSKKTKIDSKSAEMIIAKEKSTKNAVEHAGAAKKTIRLGEQKAADTSKKRVHIGHQETAVRSHNTQTKTMKSPSKSTGLHPVRKKSGKSAEGQAVTKTMTTNAVVGEERPCYLQDNYRDKKEKDKANLEQNAKRKMIWSIAQAPFVQKKCGKGAPRLLAAGTMLLEKYRIEQMIGGGGFGQIYRAFDESKKRIAAVKAIPQDHEPARMVLEQIVLVKLRGSPHIPSLYASGCTETTHFIVMELLGKNLSELRRRESSQRFSLQTVVMCGIQAVDAIKTVHDADFIHRDIKPSNFCIGIQRTTRRTIYLLDFGMVRRFRRKSGEERKKRDFAGFRGTLRYASFNVHLGKEQTPTDDFISLYYSFVELGEGSLPWKSTKNSEEVKTLKLNTSFDDFCKHLPKNFHEFLEYLLQLLEKNHLLDYDNLKQILRKNLPPNFNEAKAPFDWEIIDHSVDAVTTHDSQRI